MKKILTVILGGLMACATSFGASPVRYAGGDISLLPDYEKAGAKYSDHNGEAVADFLPWCKEKGMNAMRVRLFVNPTKFKAEHAGDYDPNACQDMEYILPLCKRIVNAGLALMLDIHYSDTWADPAKQWTPSDWSSLNDAALAQMVYDYTKQTLEELKANGVVPTFIQTGNEISYGMLWGPYNTGNPLKTLMGNSANWARLGELLTKAGKACREVCPDAKIIIHTERTPEPNVLANFYTKMAELGVDYDIIGLSYYPYWHGDLSVLEQSLATLEKSFPSKNIMIVETGYALKWEVPGSTVDTTSKWPLTEQGQAAFAKDLVDMLERHDKVDGLFWWWMEYNPYNTSLQGWYNAPLFDPFTGRATLAFDEICKFATPGAGIDDIVIDNNGAPTQWYDLSGRRVDENARGIVVNSRGEKVLK